MMGRKSIYQMVNRGRTGAPRWCVEKTNPDGTVTHQYSNRSRTVAEGFLRFARETERKEKTMKGNPD